MSPRPRRVQDDEVLDAAERVMAALGPVRITVDHIARELGVSAPALLRRFGSKRALLLAVHARGVRRAHAGASAGGAPAAATLADLFAHLERSAASTAPSREALANSYAFLHADLADAETRALILEQVRAIRAALRALVGAIVAGGELRGDPDAIADLLEVTWNGALVSWMVDGDGAAWPFVRRRLEAVLAPYRAS